MPIICFYIYDMYIYCVFIKSIIYILNTYVYIEIRIISLVQLKVEIFMIQYVKEYNF
jgi:hypothetical protein